MLSLVEMYRLTSWNTGGFVGESMSEKEPRKKDVDEIARKFENVILEKVTIDCWSENEKSEIVFSSFL